MHKIILLPFLLFIFLSSCTGSGSSEKIPAPAPETAAPDPAVEPFGPGVIHKGVKCLDNSGHSYNIYIPESIPADSLAPLLLAFDSQGKGMEPVGRYFDLADSLGWIVAASNSSRNGLPIQLSKDIARATLADIQQRAPVDPHRLYLTGFSGGARVAAAVAQERKDIAGVIGCGAGFQPQPNNQNFSFYGLVGLEDFNHLEFRQLDRALAPFRSPYWIASFEGGHAWPPPSDMLRALEWMDFRAMAYGVAPKDQARIAAKAEAIESGRVKGPYAEWNQKRELLSWIQGLDPIAASLDKELGEYTKQVAYQQERQRLLDLEQEEIEMRERYQFEVTTKDVPYWQGKAAELRRIGKAKNERGRMHMRVVNYLSLLAYSHCSQFLTQNDLINAEKFIQIYAAVDPPNSEHAFMLCQLKTRQNDLNAALDALEVAASLGFKDKLRLLGDPQLAPLQGNQRFDDIVEGMELE